MFPPSNPTTGVFRNYPPGPHSGMDPDRDAQVAPDSIDSRARSALTLGLLSLVFSVLTGTPAIWFGRNALRHISAAQGDVKGRWAAWAGIALGCLSVVVLISAWTYLHTHS